MQQFTSFLAQIGIDPYLLLAQIVNFGLLLLILNKFIYRSVVEKIEAGEKELEKTKTEQTELETAKEKFMKQKKSELSKAKTVSRQIIVEADEMAEEIKKNAQLQAKKETAEIIAQMKKQASTRQAKLKTEQVQKIKEQMMESMTELTRRINGASPEVAGQLQTYFLNGIPKKLEDFPGETFKKTNPHITLETALPLSDDQKNDLQNLLSKKFGGPVRVTEKTESDLISGYRLEIDGIATEDNLLNELIHATQAIK